MDELLAMVAGDDFEDTVPEDFRKFYKKGGDGNYVLAPKEAGGYGIANVKKLTKAANEARKERDDALKALDPFKDEDGELLDVEEARQALKALAENTPEDTNKRIAEKVQAELRKAAEAHQKALDQMKAERDALLNENDSGLIERALVEAMNNDSDGRATPAGDPAPLLNAFRGRLKVFRDDGKPVVKVLDPDTGGPASGSTGEEMSVLELVDQKRNDSGWAPYWKPKVTKGTTPPPNQSTRRSVNVEDRDIGSLSPVERLARARAAEQARG